MADPMKIRATMVGDKTEVKVLMAHEMETGQRKDSKGAVVPAWFIQNVTATVNGTTAPFSAMSGEVMAMSLLSVAPEPPSAFTSSFKLPFTSKAALFHASARAIEGR
ncbi:MAG TPA: thiosulfate oxidation carrier complex protein SoxZ, partial [Usitatibacter sp.]|nr:thiosulfate oxidation carrier complex protein SoxZ [Usitatibacter sp.]